MFLSGIISILQIAILPGIIFLSLFKFKTDTVIQKWLYIFAFSLFANYVLVTILVLLSVYTIYVMRALLAAEMILLAFLNMPFIKALFYSGKQNFQQSKKLLYLFIKYYNIFRKYPSSAKIIIISAGIILLFYISLFWANLGTIFYFVDTVKNYEWNSWAIDFANNSMPKYSFHFPQLIPANWSICYVMINKTDVHFFPKAIMPLFIIGNLLIFIDLAYSKRTLFFLFALIIYGLFAPIIYSLVFIADGNADLPVSFFAFLTFYSFLKIPQNKTDLKYYGITFLFAAAAAATKLAGFYTFAIVSLLLAFLVLKNIRQIKTGDIFKGLLFTAIICSISLFWYIKAPEAMYSGLHQPEYIPEGYWKIFNRAVNLMYYNWGAPVFIFFVITLAASLFFKKEKINGLVDLKNSSIDNDELRIMSPWQIQTRIVTLVMVLIPVVLWMFKYSSDFRNLSFVIPFLSLCSTDGLFKLVNIPRLRKNRKTKEQFSNFTRSRTSAKYISNSVGKVSAKIKSHLILTACFSGLLIIVFLTDWFYFSLFKIYDSINKYYFLSHRINYFTETGLLLHVDFYQRVFIIMGLLLFILVTVILIKLRLKVILIFLTISITAVNFTLFKEEMILKQQEEAFKKIDARNYYQVITTIIKSKHLRNYTLVTNFKELQDYKLNKVVKLRLLDSISSIFLLQLFKNTQKSESTLVFLKYSDLTDDIKRFFYTQSSEAAFTILFDDKEYIFFEICQKKLIFFI